MSLDIVERLRRIAEKAENSERDVLTWDDTKAIIQAADKIVRLRKALEVIEQWKLPATGKFWKNDDGSLSDRPISYETQWGSSGARDFIRQTARQALSGDTP